MSWLTPEEVGKLVKVSAKTVLNWCHKNKDPLPHKQVRHVYRIREDHFWEWWYRDYAIQSQKVEKLADMHVV